jgi:biopolymer transport protein ExbB
MTTPAPAPGQNPYGLIPALEQGGPLTWAVFGILVIMSLATWYILFTKLFEQQKIFNQGRRARATFWQSSNLREGSSKLERNSAYKQLVDDAIQAQDQHGKLTDPVEQHEWILGSLNRSHGAIASKLGTGLALLATVGSTAPFIGLLGTVMGINNAIIKIGARGQASIDVVAGPVGEALIMTAIGLIVAVPAVMAYNWLLRRNKAALEELAKFSNDLHGYIVSGGAVKPTVAAAPSRPSAAPGGATASGSAAGMTNPGVKKV